MRSEAEEILQAARAAAEQGAQLCLMTVVASYGSSPRPPGSFLVLAADGRFWGSVSGGCIEEDLLERLQENFPAAPLLRTYGATEQERERLQLPCGGQLKLLLQPLGLELIDAILEPLSRRQIISISTDLLSGENCVQIAGPEARTELSEKQWRNVLGPRWRMVMVGAGPIARYLAEMGAAVGLGAVLVDPRPDYIGQWQPEWAPLIKRYPDDALAELGLDSHTMVVALSHDPKLDDLAMIAALDSEAAYVGAMGSARTSAARRQRLQEHFGFSAQSLARLRAPIGLDIGSKTPAEIAVSIVADLIRVRRG